MDRFVSIAVYHQTRDSFGSNPNFPEDFHHVADVEVEDHEIERAFELTNSISGKWWENEGVIPNFDSPAFFKLSGEKGCRSSSVNDVFVLSSGKILRCMGSGWKWLPDEAHAWLDGGHG